MLTDQKQKTKPHISERLHSGYKCKMYKTNTERKKTNLFKGILSAS